MVLINFYKLVDTSEARQLLLEKLLNQKNVCFDTETTGLVSLEVELIGFPSVGKKERAITLVVLKIFKKNREILEAFKLFLSILIP